MAQIVLIRSLTSLLPHAKPTVKNLGVIMNSDFKLDEKASVCVLGILQWETAAIFRVGGFAGLHTAAEEQPINSLRQSQRKLSGQQQV